MKNLRLIAAQIINDVTKGRSLTESFDLWLGLPRMRTPLRGQDMPQQIVEDARDRAFIKALCFGVCRFYPRLEFLLENLLKKPLKEKESILHALLCVGLYQLMEMRTAQHAAVAETVKASVALKKPWARGFINAILREYLRRKDEFAKKIQNDPTSYYAHPAWLISAIKSSWPNHWGQILCANNTHPPLSIRVNQRNRSREDYLKELEKQGYKAHAITETHSGIIVDTVLLAENLPGFAKGDVFVQDGAAQLVAEIMPLAKGQRVLDACAAPGGKLTHILESKANLAEVLAIDKDAKRMALVKQNLARLKVNTNLKVTCLSHDVADVKKWWDGKFFDSILLDAPCSASGVIRRHPDIKLLRKPTDIQQFAKEQERLLEAVWGLLKPNGMLLYVTCSIFPQENEEVLRSFFAKHSNAREKKITASWGIPRDIGRQILPGTHEMDGFYYGLIEKLDELSSRVP